MKALLRSSAARLVLTLSALFVCAMVAVFGATYVFIGSQLRDRLRVTADSELDELRAAWQRGGLDALQTAVRLRIDGSRDGNALFVLQHLDGRSVAANARGLEAVDGTQEVSRNDITYQTSPDQDIDDTDVFYVSGAVLGDYFVAAGMSDHDVDETQEILITSFTLGLLATVGLTLTGGFLLSRRMQFRLSEIRGALERVAAGDLTQSIPGTEYDDDVGAVVRLVNGTVQDLRAVMDSVRQISNDIAHDLKRPLARLQDQLSRASDRAEEGGDVTALLASTYEQTRNIQAIFEALLRIAQIESGERRARFKPVSLASLLADLHGTFSPVATDGGYRLVMAASDDPGIVSGDEELLIQLFVNLIENCLVHTPRGTTITLSVTRSNDTVTACVADDGPGIAAADRELVTRRFYRCDKSRTTDGSGLGLSLVAAVVSLHEAQLELSDNDPGLAVKVTFRLAPG